MPVSSLSELCDFLKAAARPTSVRKLASERAQVVRNVAFRITVASPKSPVAVSPACGSRRQRRSQGPAVTHDIDFASRKSIAAGKTMGGECS